MRHAEHAPSQDAYHELFHEPDGVKEKFMDECTSWILKHAVPIARPARAAESEGAQVGPGVAHVSA